MKTLISVFFFLEPYYFCLGQGQEMVYKSGFIFKSKKLDSSGQLYLIRSGSSNLIDTIGSFYSPQRELVFITKPKEIIQHIYQPVKMKSRRLLGAITKRKGDSIFIKFWPFENDPFQSEKNIVNTATVDSNFLYLIKTWKGKKRNKFDFPFKFDQLMATNLPFRVLTRSGMLESDFLNANIALQHVHGSDRIYKSELMKPRSRYYALGVYVGLSSISNPLTSRNEFGLNYGFNLTGGIQSLNFTMAYGFQNGFKTGTKEIQPYVGFGIGFKLLETFIPEIKSSDE